jgi:uncharacterized cysteine cluster protein YcgN (CxxCxxCC family)
MVAEPAGQRVQGFVIINGLGEFTPIWAKSVKKYLADCCKKRERRRNILPKCLEIANNELKGIEWCDQCFVRNILRMFEGADLSQLERFYGRYPHAKHPTTFFLNFIRYEL